MTSAIKRLPKSFRFGGTPLYVSSSIAIAPQPDGVRRVNETCVELETYANYVQRGAVGFIGMSVIITVATYIVAVFALGIQNMTHERVTAMLAMSPALTVMAFIFYLAGGANRSKGAFIRIHRGTRKLYFVYPRKKRLHVLDWDQLEALAGYIPIISASGYASRHPLYLIGVDYNMDPPTEICAACGNLGLFDGDRSAKTLWSYLQVFMTHGPEGLPEPAPLPPRRTRIEETLQPYRDWYAGLRRRLAKPFGWLKAPITLPLWLGWLFINAFPDSVEAFIQYNVPYAQFPKEIDRLCGFDDKRTPVIRVNGERIEP
ncbi:hypothetical protein SAMN05428937_5154 [Achromobacter sp. MFA1 R4]|nr:hypothetical protein SAMN05428937_5154 [Achromobacter sp. MFA1 R4]